MQKFSHQTGAPLDEPESAHVRCEIGNVEVNLSISVKVRKTESPCAHCQPQSKPVIRVFLQSAADEKMADDALEQHQHNLALAMLKKAQTVTVVHDSQTSDEPIGVTEARGGPYLLPVAVASPEPAEVQPETPPSPHDTHVPAPAMDSQTTQGIPEDDMMTTINMVTAATSTIEDSMAEAHVVRAPSRSRSRSPRPLVACWEAVSWNSVTGSPRPHGSRIPGAASVHSADAA